MQGISAGVYDVMRDAASLIFERTFCIIMDGEYFERAEIYEFLSVFVQNNDEISDPHKKYSVL